MHHRHFHGLVKKCSDSDRERQRQKDQSKGSGRSPLPVSTQGLVTVHEYQAMDQIEGKRYLAEPDHGAVP